MDGTTVMIILISAGIFGCSIYLSKRKNEQLLSEGKIVEREKDFMEKAEEFSLTVKEPSQVAEGVRKISYSEMSVTMKADSEGQSFHFSNTWGWNARLYYKGKDGEKSVYCFEFLNWKTKDYMIQGGLYMSMLLTAIEKMFLDIDPNTQVTTRHLNTKTKHSFF